MKVLAVTHEASATGSVRAFIYAIDALRESNEVEVVTKQGGDLLVDLGPATKLEPWRGAAQLRRLARIRPLARTAPAVERQIARAVIHRARPDVVYVNTAMSAEYVWACQRIGLPCVLHVHEMEPLLSWALSRHQVDCQRLTALVPAPFVARQLAALGCPRVTTLPGPVDTSVTVLPLSQVPWAPNSLRVLTVASTLASKGTHDFIDLAGRLPSIEGTPVNYAWLGPGDKAELTRLTREKGVSNLVWLDPVRNPLDYMAAADLLVHPAHGDLQPLSLLESLSVDTPCVAYSTGATPDILRIDEALAPVGDLEALALRVSAALTDHSLRDRMLDSVSDVLECSQVTSWQQGIMKAMNLYM
jgi:glycosyltransferase involved in cell wall biosynthesis